jgi:hypothetical protein
MIQVDPRICADLMEAKPASLASGRPHRLMRPPAPLPPLDQPLASRYHAPQVRGSRPGSFARALIRPEPHEPLDVHDKE